MLHRLLVVGLFPAVIGMYLPFCATEVRVTTPAADAPRATLWEEPVDLADRDLFYGPWGSDRAPRANDRYTLIEVKHTGVNPGMTVVDSTGREWSVKQSLIEGPDEGPIEVVVSRLLSALGYHQPPVYYLPAFTLVDDWGAHVARGGRFRLKLKALKDRGEWSWQQNPFVGSQPYQGLLVMLMLVNGSDLKNSNNTLYEYRSDAGLEVWYVARDVGTALGTTGRFVPLKGDAEALARDPFINGVRDGYVEFDYDGWHQELVRQRITPADLGWTADWLSRLGDRQWQDAFRAGGYAPEEAQRFIAALKARIQDARAVADAAASGWPGEE